MRAELLAATDAGGFYERNGRRCGRSATTRDGCSLRWSRPISATGVRTGVPSDRRPRGRVLLALAVAPGGAVIADASGGETSSWTSTAVAERAAPRPPAQEPTGARCAAGHRGFRP